MVLLVPDNMPESGPSTLTGQVDEMQNLFKNWDPRSVGKGVMEMSTLLPPHPDLYE